MEQNNNQHIEQTYTKDDAYHSLEMINTWINNMDTKVSFALALTGVLIGIIFGTGIPKALQKVGEVSKLAELKRYKVFYIRFCRFLTATNSFFYKLDI